MMKLRDLLAGLGVATGDSFPERTFASITQDSRTVQPGDLFLARRGEVMDGHVFIADALARGATGILAERVTDVRTDVWIIDTRDDTRGDARHDTAGSSHSAQAVVYVLVADTQKALERVAAWWRRQLLVTVIGVTGSVGKTSTKDLVAAVLGNRFSVLKSERSLNTDVGMALTLLQLEGKHQVAVLEMGMYGRGEIAHLCSLAAPQIGVVTNVGPTHLERLGSIEGIAEAKSELVRALPADGIAILNGDDARVRAMKDRGVARVTMYGLTPGLDVWASHVESHGLEGVSFRIHWGGKSVAVRTHLPGSHNVYTALAASAAGLALGLTLEEVAARLRQAPNSARLVVVTAASGATLIDDSYNASPASVVAALDLLAEMKGRRVAVLGDMLELGSYEEEGHRLVGRRVGEVADLLVAVGQRGHIIGEEALRQGMAESKVLFAAGTFDAAAFIGEHTGAGDYILVKGSRGMRMEEIVRLVR
jgi:UDP-N-acetylmuramoyl-tripeptide--D-alanyl-D-alanine ligase